MPPGLGLHVFSHADIQTWDSQAIRVPSTVAYVKGSLRAEYAKLEIVPIARRPTAGVNCAKSAVREFHSHHETVVGVQGKFIDLVIGSLGKSLQPAGHVFDFRGGAI